MLDAFIRLDTNIMLWLNSIHSPFWDVFMSICSDKWTWVPMYCVILYVLLWKYGFRVILLWITIMFALTIILSDQLCGGYIRTLIARQRPSNLANPISHFVHVVDGYRGGRYGFPSCHAANSFALATLLFLFFRNRFLTTSIYCWAILNSYTRVYLGVHYPGDILAGAIVGSAGSIMIYYGFRYYIKFEHKETYKQINMISYTGIATVTVVLVFSFIKTTFY